MKLEQIYQMITIEKCKSISKAAKALYVSQPSLSASLASLEQEIGVKIFDRTGTGVQPTEQGKEILRIAREIQQLTRRIQEFSSNDSNLTGEVQLRVTPAYGFLTHEVVLKFKQRFPKAMVHIDELNAYEIIEQLHDGMIHMGLIAWAMPPEKNIEPLLKKNIAYEIYHKRGAHLCVSKDSSIATKEHISLADIQNEQFVCFSSAFWAVANKHINAVKEPFVLKNMQGLFNMIQTGHAIALMPDMFEIEEIYCQRGLVKIVHVDEIMEIHGWDYLLYPAKRSLTVLEQGLLEVMREVLKQYQPSATQL